MESVVLEAIPVQMSLELLDGNINIKINASQQIVLLETLEH